jgi:diacylglycerol kinase family enzyme
VARIGIILNPNSGKNRKAAPGRAERLQAIVGDQGVVVLTRSLDELGPALKALLESGVQCLVSDGGDGALHWMLNEGRKLLGDEALPPALPTNGGTIDFVAKKAGLKGDAERLVASLVSHMAGGAPPPELVVDSLEITGSERVGDELRPYNRIGFAVAAGGVAQRFFDTYYADGGRGAAGIVSVVRRTVSGQLADALHLPCRRPERRVNRHMFRPTQARVTLDGAQMPQTEFSGLNAGAFDVSLGGVFRIFPLAKQPGAIHFQVGDIGPWEVIRSIPALARGGLIRSDRLIEVQGAELIIEAVGDESLAPIIDGESFPGVRTMTLRPGPKVRLVTL